MINAKETINFLTNKVIHNIYKIKFKVILKSMDLFFIIFFVLRRNRVMIIVVVKTKDNS